jgi:hypothetical protein
MKKRPKDDSQSFADKLEEKLIDFAVRIIRLSARLPRTPAGKHVAGQILRSGTSPCPKLWRSEGLLKAGPISFTRSESCSRNSTRHQFGFELLSAVNCYRESCLLISSKKMVTYVESLQHH